MPSAKTSKISLAFWLVLDVAVVGFVSLQCLGWPEFSAEAPDDQQAQDIQQAENQQAEDQQTDEVQRYAQFSGDLRDEGSLKVGDVAPNFSLATSDGRSTVSLSDFRDQKPVVLVFGSYSCPIFRRQFDGLKELSHRYRGEAEFFVVYIQEAHPADGHPLQENDRESIRIGEHKTLEDRRQAAATCSAALGGGLPVLVDAMDNKLRQEYAAWPVRLYVIGQDGRIAYKGHATPERFTLAEMMGTLDRELRAAAGGARTTAMPDACQAGPVVAGG
jgi:hypothetical protein